MLGALFGTVTLLCLFLHSHIYQLYQCRLALGGYFFILDIFASG